MDEVQSNQDSPNQGPSPGAFTDMITGAVFANHGEVGVWPAGSSSPQAQRVPMIARRPPHSQVAPYDNLLGVGFPGSDNLLDDQSLTWAFRNMSLGLRGGAADSPATLGIVASRNGYCPEGLVVSPVNSQHQLGVAQDGFMPSPLRTNGFEHMKPNSCGRNVPMYTEMHGLDDFSGAPCRSVSPSAPPFKPQFFIDGWTQSHAPNHQQMGSNFRWQDIEAERHPLVHPQFAYQHVPQIASSDVFWSRSNRQGAIRSSLAAASSSVVNNCGCKKILMNRVEANQIVDRHEHFDRQNSQILSSLESQHDLAMKAQLKYSSLDEVEEKIYFFAKDQNGCRLLQKIFTEGPQEDVKKVFDGIIKHIGELMVDQFGNYLVQKVLEECNDDQKMHIIHEITKIPGWLISISCNMHGTRAVQKVIETINTSDEVRMVVSALSPGAVTLMVDPNGSHVAHRCLQKLSLEYKAFLLNAAIKHYFELAQDRQGCCILQKCIVYANNEQKNQLLYNITSRTLDLSEHQYGNYVIQYILGLRITWATDEILDKLEGNYRYLSMQKCSSNVVEKCLKETPEPKRMKIILELINDPKLLHVLLDQYGNYVIQTALHECEDAAVRAALIAAIRPHAAALRNNMFGKRILSKTYPKNRKS